MNTPGDKTTAAGPLCHLCNKPIIFRDHETTGRPMPLDAEPNDTGPIILLPGGKYRFLQLVEQAGWNSKQRAGEEVPPRYTSHMATCEVYQQRQKDRRKRGNRAEY